MAAIAAAGTPTTDAGTTDAAQNTDDIAVSNVTDVAEASISNNNPPNAAIGADGGALSNAATADNVDTEPTKEAPNAQGTAPNAKDTARTYRYTFRNSKSSIYSAVDRLLQQKPHWERLHERAKNYDLLISCLAGCRWSHIQVPDGHGRRVCVNHVRGMQMSICKKVKLALTMRAYTAELEGGGGTALLDRIMPRTFVLVPGALGKLDERALFLAAADADTTLWIAKSTSGAHGAEVKVCQGAAEAIAHVDTVDAGENAAAEENVKPWQRKPPSPWMVQRYVTRPFLLAGDRKFDVRAVVVVTSSTTGPGLAVWWYDRWILRTSGEKYDLDDLSNVAAHITNNCLQKESSSYGRFEQDNELFAEDFRAVLGDDAAFDAIVAQMQAIVLHTLAAVRERVGAGGTFAYNSWQLLGYDFLIDADRRVSLLEVNSHAAVSTRMTDAVARALIELAIDPLFPPAAAAGEGAAPTRSPGNMFRRIGSVGSVPEAFPDAK